MVEFKFKPRRTDTPPETIGGGRRIDIPDRIVSVAPKIERMLKKTSGVRKATLDTDNQCFIVAGTPAAFCKAAEMIQRHERTFVDPITVVIPEDGWGSVQPILRQTQAQWRRLIASCPPTQGTLAPTTTYDT